METDLEREWVASVWPQVKQLCEAVDPSDILTELAAGGWKRSSDDASPTPLGDPSEELHALVTKELPARGFCELDAFCKTLDNLRTKLLSHGSQGDVVVSGSLGQESQAEPEQKAEFRPSRKSLQEPRPPVVREKLQRVKGSESSKAAAAVLVKKGDRAIQLAQKKRALRMYLKAFKLHPGEPKLYEKVYEVCMNLKDYENAVAVCNFWIWDFPPESKFSAKAYTKKVKALTADSQTGTVLKTLQEGYTVTRKSKFLRTCFESASQIEGE
jgi:tetratricopeptide (TPR) repeat protein